MGDPTRSDVHRLSLTIAAMAALALGMLSAARAVDSVGRPLRLVTSADGVRVLRDPSRALTFDGVREAERRGALRTMDPAHTNFSYTNDAFWIVVPLRADAGRATNHVLELSTTPVRAVLHAVDRRGRVAPPQESGTGLAFDQRPLVAANVAFPLTLAPGDPVSVYVRIESDDTMAIDPLLWDRADFDAKERNGRMLDGAYYGGLLAIVLYNLFLFFGTADGTYLAYVVFELLLVVYQAIADKYALEYLWPACPGWSRWAGQVSALAVAVAGLVFADRFLRLRATMPRVHRIFQGLLLVGVILLGLSCAGVATPKPVLPVFVLVTVVAAAYASGALALARDRPALLFLVAWVFLLAGATLAGLNVLGLLQASHWFLAIKAGSAMEATLMSLVLAHRIAALRRDRERAQADLLALRTAQTEALERRVAERTQELAETVEHLRQTRAAFVRQDRLATVGRMVAGVVHEVGNPLNFLRGGVAELERALTRVVAETDGGQAPGQGLGEESPPPSRELQRSLGGAQRALALVRGGSERIDQIIQNLRGYVRRDPPPPEVTDVVAVLRATLAFLDTSLRDARVELVTDWQPVPPVLFVPGQLGQVVSNLVINACQAMPDGGTLFIGCRFEEGAIRIVLRDSGPGVPREVRDHIFEPFVSGRRGGENAGLGLYVCQEIVSRHGGELWLAEPGDGERGGATFCLSLSVIDVADWPGVDRAAHAKA